MKIIRIILILFSLTGVIISVSSFSEKQNNKVNSHYTLLFAEFETGTTASLRAIHVVDESVVWATGSNGTFLLTTDEGLTWRASETMPSGFRSCIVWLKDEKTIIAFVIGPTGSDYSTDFGKNWTFSGDTGYHTQ